MNAAGQGGARGWDRVLVIDDDADIGRVLRRILETAGYEVVLSEDGLRGLAAAQRQQPDVIVLDLMMPVMDGYEVLTQLRGDPRTTNISVVVLSALTQADCRDRALQMGATAYLTKPFVAEELFEAVSAGITATGARRGRRSDIATDVRA